VNPQGKKCTAQFASLVATEPLTIHLMPMQNHCTQIATAQPLANEHSTDEASRHRQLQRTNMSHHDSGMILSFSVATDSDPHIMSQPKPKVKPPTPRLLFRLFPHT